MVSSCCGSTTKSKADKVAIPATQDATEVATERHAANHTCCNESADDSAKGEKRSCGC